MGLYDNKSGLGKRKKYLLIALATFVIVLALAFLIFGINWQAVGSGLKGSNISVKFSKNPFTIDKDKDLKLIVTIENDSGADSENASIIIYPVEKIFFVQCESSKTESNKVVIPILAKDTKRVISCDLKKSPNLADTELLPGTYAFDVVYVLNSVEYEKRAILTLKK